jgi:hypothetical protein
MMRPSHVDVSDEDEEVMNIELQATDSSGSSSYDEEAEDDSSYSHKNNAKVSSAITRDALGEDIENAFTSPPPRRCPLSLFTLRQQIAIAVGILPVCIFGLEMIPERCNVCLEGVKLDSYFLTAAICGGLGALLYGDSLDSYWLARLMGGAISALGSLFTIWMLLQSIPSNVAFLFLFVGLLGAMPGVVAYFLIRIVSDECYVSDLNDYDELAPLSRLHLSDD